MYGLNSGKILCIPVLAIVLLILGGCAGVARSDWAEDVGPGNEVLQPLTKEIRIIADSQIHESRGTPSRYISLAGDEFIGVTVRSGQQVIGAADLLAASIADDYPLTLHLGDAIDLSCQTEWTLFNRAMTSKFATPGADTWLLALGNHDGFMTGNIYPTNSGLYVADYWDNMCNVGRTTVTDASSGAKISLNKYRFETKKSLVDDYMQKLKRGMGVDPATPDNPLCQDDRFCASYFSENGWSTSVVQLVKLPEHAPGNGKAIHALLLDTSDFDERPYIGIRRIKAGVRGGITARQLKQALALVNRMPLDARFFIVAHHPYAAWRLNHWREESVGALGELMNDPRFMDFILTAHTHTGGWYSHSRGNKVLHELNIGSLADAPLYYRTLRFARDESNRVVIDSRRMSLTQDRYEECGNVPAPGIGYTADEQKSVYDRNSDKGPIIRFAAGFTNAARHFFRLWHAKHTELKPQLLSYADVVMLTMPANTRIKTPERTYAGPEEVVSTLRDLADCTHATKCAVQRKGHLLMALEEYYWDKDNTPEAVRAKAHKVRYCMAVRLADESAETALVANVMQRTRGETRRLPASAAVPAHP